VIAESVVCAPRVLSLGHLPDAHPHTFVVVVSKSFYAQGTSMGQIFNWNAVSCVLSINRVLFGHFRVHCTKPAR